MTTLHEAATQALEALEDFGMKHYEETGEVLHRDVYESLKAALAEPVQEPVAWRFEARHIDTAFGPAVSIRHPGREHKYMRNVKPLYAAPPQRTAEPVQEQAVCDECGKHKRDGWALYCVGCVEPMFAPSKPLFDQIDAKLRGKNA